MDGSMGFSGRKGLEKAQLDMYRSYVPGVDDVIWQPLYDYQTYPLAGAAAGFTFFSVPKGAGATSAFGAAAGVKSLLDTNMQLSGQLGAGNQFLCMGVEIEFWPGSVPGLQTAAQPTDAQTAQQADDVYSVLRNGYLELQIQNRPYVQDAPLMKFPTQTCLTGWSAVTNGANATAAIQHGYASGYGLAYNIVPVLITQNQAFSVIVTFPAAIALPSGVDGRIGCRLNGKLIRNAQ